MKTRKATDIPPTLGERPVTAAEHQLFFQLYEQVCETWRDVSDTRFKLLGLLPVGTVVALIGLHSAEDLSAMTKCIFSAGGLLISLGLFFYEENNDANRMRLFERGRRIEFELGIKEGVFMRSEQSKTTRVSHGTALYLIYGTCLLAWCLSVLASLFHVMYCCGR